MFCGVFCVFVLSFVWPCEGWRAFSQEVCQLLLGAYGCGAVSDMTKLNRGCWELQLQASRSKAQGHVYDAAVEEHARSLSISCWQVVLGGWVQCCISDNLLSTLIEEESYFWQMESHWEHSDTITTQSTTAALMSKDLLLPFVQLRSHNNANVHMHVRLNAIMCMHDVFSLTFFPAFRILMRILINIPFCCCCWTELIFCIWTHDPFALFCCPAETVAPRQTSTFKK